MRLGVVACLIAAFFATDRSLAANPVDDKAALGEFFEKKIRPLLSEHCYECHSAETAENSGQLALDGRAGLLAGGTRGPVVVAGKADESLLITAVRYADPKLQMPPDGKLSNADVELLVEWVQKGGFVPEYGEAKQKKGNEIDWDSARQFWSFQPLHRQATPDCGIGVNVDQPIDSFVRQALAQHHLTPSAMADKRTLARRVSFDLTGLPPSVEQTEEFVTDPRPDAYERFVDRLMSSPHFGERFARYWLDLARYTDVTPTWLKNADQAWIYRDWVVRAMNEDLPYDDFVKRQLAADVLENVAPADYAALGLIGLSPTYWKELRLAPGVIEVIVADEWDERIDAVSRTFLGLTVACARCHDHKFDSITTKDYYALAGVFASTQLTDRPLLPSPLAEQIAEARQKVDALEESLKAVKDKESDEARKLKTQIDTLRTSTPQFNQRMAHTVEEASVFVLPDGPEMTKLDVRKRQPRDLPIFRRGNPANPGDVVPRRFLEVLSPTSPQPFTSGSGRREFAEALFRESRGLTARVMVNRIWSYHFGRGLVRTPSDFGAQGDRPTHPELLEWLATDFAGGIASDGPWDWTSKRLHRQLVTSATYRQSSNAGGDPATSGSTLRSIQLDPENQWLSRMNRRRLDVEPWRDAMLAAAGSLDPTLEGPAIDLDASTNLRRTLYGRVGRDEQNDMLRLFDFPPPTSHSPARDATTTPLQQLFLLNSDFVETQSTALVARINAAHPDSSTKEKIRFCYQLLLQRDPDDNEIRLGERFLARSDDAQVTEPRRWPLYIQSLFGLNELLFVD